MRLLHALPPEAAHGVAAYGCKLYGAVPIKAENPRPMLQQTLCGMSFRHPLGMAAGFDKNAVAYRGLLKLGFSFSEAGTVTPLAQSGNPKPRLFRLSEDEAVINRMGFNNKGLGAFSKVFSNQNIEGVLGANIGCNKDTQKPEEDYLKGLDALYEKCDYFTVNISSPNTPGLRDLQQESALQALLSRLMRARSKLADQYGVIKPIWLKVAPDLDDEAMGRIVGQCLDVGIDALIVSNTTIERPESLKSCHRAEAGGLSGQPLKPFALHALKVAYRAAQGQLPLIGVGGIGSAENAYARIRAGASLLQLYTALIYHGPALINDIINGLEGRLRQDGFSHISEAIGVDANDS